MRPPQASPCPAVEPGADTGGRSNRAAVKQRSGGAGYRGQGTGCHGAKIKCGRQAGNRRGRARYAGLVSHAPQRGRTRGRPQRQLRGCSAGRAGKSGGQQGLAQESSREKTHGKQTGRPARLAAGGKRQANDRCRMKRDGETGGLKKSGGQRGNRTEQRCRAAARVMTRPCAPRCFRSWPEWGGAGEKGARRGAEGSRANCPGCFSSRGAVAG